MNEELIFEMYKDRPIKNARTFKGELRKKFKNIDVSNLFVRITNYQISKFGRALMENNWENRSEEELRKITDRAKHRKYCKRRRR